MKIYNKIGGKTMKQPPRQRPVKDERDEQIEAQSKRYAMDCMATATQILTVICLLKGNPAWKGSLSLLFFGFGFIMFYQYRQYMEKLYRHIGIVSLVIGVALMAWFVVTG